MVNSRLLWEAHGTQKADSAPIGWPGGIGGGWGVSEAREAFVTILAVATWLGFDTAKSGGAMQTVGAG